MSALRPKTFATALVFFVPGGPASSDYNSLTLFQMLKSSEFIVNGNVQAVENGEYNLTLTRIFAGSDQSGTVMVARADSNLHDTRSGDFVDGQSITLFGVATDNDRVRPLGRAAEGEVLRDARYAYVRSISRPPATLVRAKVPDGTGKAYRIEAEVFDLAISGFFDCYTLTPTEEISRQCSDQDLASYQNSSWLAAHLSGIAERLIRRGD